MSTPLSSSQNSNARPGRRRGGVIIPNEANFWQRLAARIIYLVLATIAATVRYRWKEGEDTMEQVKGPAIYCIWHNRLSLCLPIYWRFAQRKNPTKGMAAMASASKDGAFLAAIIRCFGVHAARGSSSRRGPQALLELTSWAERGYDLAITPDGPRGPKYRVQPGVISLAQVTGLPILPSIYNLRWKIEVKSWDRFQIPLPFSRCDVYLGKPVFVPREADDEQREKLRQEVEAAILLKTKD